MEVILRKDVEKVGNAGEIVKVKPGFGRNYLIPHGLAFLATDGNKARVESERKAREKMIAEQKSEARALAKKLSSATLTFKAKAGEGERLFGSITSADVADELLKQGFEVDKRTVQIDEPIRELGEATINIKLHPEVSVELKVNVEKED